jgi:hypothetical protein
MTGLDIHPEIRAFYESKDYTIEPRSANVIGADMMLWDQCKDDVILNTVALIYRDIPDFNSYYYDNVRYTEKQMLGIVRGLLAFL